MIARWRIAMTVVAVLVAGVTCAGRSSGSVQDPARLRSELVLALARGRPERVDSLLARRPADSTVRLFRGLAAAERGRVTEADSVLATVTGADRWVALARRAELAAAIGRRELARARADSIVATLEGRQGLPAADWLALGAAYRILGSREPALFQDALAAFDRAIAADSTLLEAHLRVGRLFLEKYNGPDATAAFREVLRRDPGNPLAELGLAEVALFDGERATFERLEGVAKSAPGNARARALMARLELDAEQYSRASATADSAIARDSTMLDAWATKAATALLRGDSVAARATDEAVARWHRAPSGYFAEVAEAVARHRRYHLAERVAARAAALDPDDPNALTALGSNRLRIGAIDSGRAVLTRAFAQDPYHVWNKNTLDLFDQTATYRTVALGRFVFVAPPDEADLLAHYLGPLMERAYDSLAARYRYRPPTPIRLELYRHHADFSVRTVGLAGLGALGVSFGTVLAMDAPSARPPGEFNWASTAWHELAHTFTLGVTDHKVPRWLSEGLSVLEERRNGAGWGAHATVAFVAALNGRQLRPLARLNDGFVRPRSPADVTFAYYHASLFCEFLEVTAGFGAVVDLLAAFKDGLDNDAALVRATKTDLGVLSARFDRWLVDRLATPLKHVGALRDTVMAPGGLAAAMTAGKQLKAAGQLQEAIAAFERADAMFPDMADPDSPAWNLAEIYRERGNPAKAAEYYGRVTRVSETHLRANRFEAEARTAIGDHAGALAAWQRAINIHPYDIEIHVKAAEAAARSGQPAIAVRERQAVLFLNPSDRSGALYELAVAFRDAGDRAAARREVLRALEEAPSFEKAQALLLELRRGS